MSWLARRGSSWGCRVFSLVSANSRNRAGLLVGAYLLSSSVCSTAIDALSLWSELRSDSHHASRTISRGVSNKMYQLYLSYFGHFCTSSMDARSSRMPNNSVFAIAKVLISYMSISSSTTPPSSPPPPHPPPTTTRLRFENCSCAGTAEDSVSKPSYELHLYLNGQALHQVKLFGTLESRDSRARRRKLSSRLPGPLLRVRAVTTAHHLITGREMQQVLRSTTLVISLLRIAAAAQHTLSPVRAAVSEHPHAMLPFAMQFIRIRLHSFRTRIFPADIRSLGARFRPCHRRWD
jgi:hypothetical protein